MVAPIFKFRNVKVKLTTNQPIFIYGVLPYDSNNADKTLAQGIRAGEVSTVLLTVQVSNLTGSGVIPGPQSVLVSAYLQNAQNAATFDVVNSRSLVTNYPLIGSNAFDPLSGNLVLSDNDQLWLQTSVANTCDVTVSLLEIANATAS